MAKVIHTVGFCLLSLACHSGHAEIYKWQDEAGNIHYTQKRPTGRDPHPVKLLPGVDTQQALYKLQQQQDSFKQKREQRIVDAEQARSAKQLADRKNEQCKNARERLDRLNNNPRLFRTDTEGNRVRMDETARQDAITDTKAHLVESCSG